MPTPLILARSFREAHAFAKDTLDLRVGHYRVVNTAGTLKAVRNVDVHLVPGWDKAPGHHAFKTALRYAKGLNVIDHAAKAQEPAPAFVVTAVPDSTEVPQHHTDMVAKVLPQSDTSNGDAMIAEGSPAPLETDFFDDVDVPAEEPEPTATCVDCGLTPCEKECVAAEAIAQVTQDDDPCRICQGVNGEHDGATHDARAADLPLPSERAEKPKAKRRSRCKECGNLHYKTDPCPEVE